MTLWRPRKDRRSVLDYVNQMSVERVGKLLTPESGLDPQYLHSLFRKYVGEHFNRHWQHEWDAWTDFRLSDAWPVAA